MYSRHILHLFHLLSGDLFFCLQFDVFLALFCCCASKFVFAVYETKQHTRKRTLRNSFLNFRRLFFGLAQKHHIFAVRQFSLCFVCLFPSVVSAARFLCNIFAQYLIVCIQISSLVSQKCFLARSTIFVSHLFVSAKLWIQKLKSHRSPKVDKKQSSKVCRRMTSTTYSPFGNSFNTNKLNSIHFFILCCVVCAVCGARSPKLIFIAMTHEIIMILSFLAFSGKFENIENYIRRSAADFGAMRENQQKGWGWPSKKAPNSAEKQKVSTFTPREHTVVSINNRLRKCKQ